MESMCLGYLLSACSSVVFSRTCYCKLHCCVFRDVVMMLSAVVDPDGVAERRRHRLRRRMYHTNVFDRVIYSVPITDSLCMDEGP